MAVLAVLLSTLAASATAAALRRFVSDVPLPGVSPVDLVAAFFDTTPLTITTTTAWTRVPEVIETHRLYTDHTVWRRMFVQDWDGLPAALRQRGLAAMLHHHRALIATRTAGAPMTAADWDAIPHPVRAMAFVNMIEHWAAIEQPGAQFGLPHGEVLRTLKAICMTESWFEHRAISTNDDGSSDLGLAQASDYARAVTNRWSAAGLWPLTMSDQDYFNPWPATRWLVAWFTVMLEESRGDLELAIRAYNVGRPRARVRGEDYLRVVLARRRRYFEGPSGSPAWAHLTAFRHAAIGDARDETSRAP